MEPKFEQNNQIAHGNTKIKIAAGVSLFLLALIDFSCIWFIVENIHLPSVYVSVLGSVLGAITAQVLLFWFMYAKRSYIGIFIMATVYILMFISLLTYYSNLTGTFN